jgi:hypothetical protein
MIRQGKRRIQAHYRDSRALLLPAQAINFFRVWNSRSVALVRGVIRTWAGLWKESRMKQIGLMPLQFYRWVNESLRAYERLTLDHPSL